VPYVRKINDNWKPAENRDLKVGETIYISEATKLIKDGTVELVEEQVKPKVQPKVVPVVEVVKPKLVKVACPICGKRVKRLGLHNKWSHPESLTK